MKTHSQASIALVAIAIFSLACASLATEPTTEPQPTDPPLPTATQTKIVPPTLRPTETPIPQTPTAMPVGTPVTNEDYEVNIVKVRKLGSVYLDNRYEWHANPGYLFLELGVKVVSRRSDINIVHIPWEHVYIIENTGDAYYPGWGGYEKIGMEDTFNPASIIFAEITDRKSQVQFPDAVMIRAIWTIKDNNPSTVLFGFDTSPLIEVVID